LADILIRTLNLARELDMNMDEAVKDKLIKIRESQPIPSNGKFI